MSSLTKVFSGEKIIASKVMNYLAVQPFRAVAARVVYRAQPAAAADSVKEEISRLRTDGLLILPNFLPADAFQQLHRECMQLIEESKRMGRFKERHHGPNVLEVAGLGHVGAGDAPALHQFLADPRLRAILEAAEKRPLGSLPAKAMLEVLTQGTPDGVQDPQSVLHSDIWFNLHKVWFYLDDVNLENGPLAYVRGTQRLVPRHLYHMYRQSIKWKAGEDPSRRITQEEIEQGHLQEAVLTCAKNTLVIANTCGYHRRLQGEPGWLRHALHLDLRANPFGLHGVRGRLARYPRLHALLRRTRGLAARPGS